jgi:shikimate kinase
MIIYLIGFMGSGKTTAGEKLATRLSCEYLDLDDHIEQQEQDTIKNLFEKKGEAYFREKESVYLRNIPEDKSYIISTGGGTPCFFDNMEFMNQTGLTVYLQLTPEQLFSRLKSQREKRPLISSKKDDRELFQYIIDKLNEREGYYQKARLIVKGYLLNMDELYHRIFNLNNL